MTSPLQVKGGTEALQAGLQQQSRLQPMYRLGD